MINLEKMGDNDVSFTKQMRKATRNVHSISDALVNAKLAFGKFVFVSTFYEFSEKEKIIKIFFVSGVFRIFEHIYHIVINMKI